MIRYVETSRGVVSVSPLMGSLGRVGVTAMHGGYMYSIDALFGHSRKSPYLYSPCGMVLEVKEEGLNRSATTAPQECFIKPCTSIAVTGEAVYMITQGTNSVMRYNPKNNTVQKFKPELTTGHWQRTHCGRLCWATQGPTNVSRSVLDDDNDVTWHEYFYPAHKSAYLLYLVNKHCFMHPTATLIQILGDYCLLYNEGDVYLNVCQGGDTSAYTTHTGDELKLTRHHYLERGEGDIILLKCSNGNGELPIALDYKERQEAAKRFAEREAEVEAKAAIERSSKRTAQAIVNRLVDSKLIKLE